MSGISAKQLEPGGLGIPDEWTDGKRREARWTEALACLSNTLRDFYGTPAKISHNGKCVDVWYLRIRLSCARVGLCLEKTELRHYGHVVLTMGVLTSRQLNESDGNNKCAYRTSEYLG